MTSAYQRPSAHRPGRSMPLSLSAYSSPLSRRYSSGSSDTRSEPGSGDGSDIRNSYYQVSMFVQLASVLYKDIIINKQSKMFNK